ncbi:MAG: methyl-accepting chemotaxis protein [Chitinivibrionales bacterium]|nr:methyl-accepting chemotaxis protein [Chitinivibrionales bacterium]
MHISDESTPITGRSSSIANKISIYIITITFVVLLANGFYNFKSTSSRLKSKLNTMAKQTTKRLAENLALPLWKMNNEIVISSIVAEMEEQQIFGILIHNQANDSILFNYSRNEKWECVRGSQKPAGSLISSSKQIEKDDLVLGSVELFLTSRFIDAEIRGLIINQIITTVILCIALMVAIPLCLKRLLIVHLEQVIVGLHDISQGEGDLTKRLVIRKNDEIGRLSFEVNTFIAKLHTLVKQAIESTQQVTTSVQSMVSGLKKISSVAETVTKRSSIVSSTTSKNNELMKELSRTASSVSKSVSDTAASIEEMSASLVEVSKSCQEEKKITSNTSEKVAGAQRKINNLEDVGKQIDSIVETIKDIADQTNLLALNATIEAASAGSMGKGFAVVASEIKALSQQTGIATSEISKQVTGIQSIVQQAITVIGEIAESFNQVNTITQVINSAVYEQTTVINHVSTIINDTSNATSSIARSIQTSTDGVTQIARNIEEVTVGMRETVDEILHINGDATSLQKQAETLDALMHHFKIA